MSGLFPSHAKTALLCAVLAALVFSLPAAAQEPPPAAAPEAVHRPLRRNRRRASRLQTSMGTIVLELNRERAPLTVANFLRYVMEGHFNNTVIYRVVPRFVIQGGSVGTNGNGKPVHEPIPLEANNGLSNLRGTITMARAQDPASATAEFFINLVDNTGLDQMMGDTANQTGYAVFGRVESGHGRRRSDHDAAARRRVRSVSRQCAADTGHHPRRTILDPSTPAPPAPAPTAPDKSDGAIGGPAPSRAVRVSL